MDTTNLLYNNTDKILKWIVEQTDLPLDVLSRGSDGDSLVISDKIRIFIGCANDEEKVVNYVRERILDWLGNQKGNDFEEYLHYFNDDFYGFNYGTRYEYRNIFNRNDIQAVNNFIRINWKTICPMVLDKINYLKTEIEKINNKRYKNVYNKVKDELYRQKIDNKNKPAFSFVQSFIERIAEQKYIFVFEDVNNIHQKIVLKDADVKKIYDDFIQKWNEKHRQSQLSSDYTKEKPNKPPVLKDTFMDKLNKYVVYNHEKLLDKDEFAKISSGWGNTRISLDEWYNRYVNKFYYQPSTSTIYDEPEEQNYLGFKSPNKVKALQKIYPDKKVYISEHTSYFPLEKNKKRYQLHKVSSRYSYIIDLMFVDKLCYLVMINVNTRYLYVILVNQILFDSQDTNNENNKQQKFAKYNKSADTYLKTLDTLINSGVIIKHLTYDGEGAFASIKALRYYKAHGIDCTNAPRIKMGNYPDFMKKEQKQVKSDPMHSSLGLIDRVIRTLRDMAYNMKIGIITPSIMEELVRQYNNAPHKTLSKYAGRSVSPKMVNDDKDLESLIVMNICKENYNIMTSNGFYLRKGTPVKLYNEKDGMMKRRSNVQPGRFKIVDFHDGLYKIKDEKNKTQRLPRWKIDV